MSDKKTAYVANWATEGLHDCALDDSRDFVGQLLADFASPNVSAVGLNLDALIKHAKAKAEEEFAEEIEGDGTVTKLEWKRDTENETKHSTIVLRLYATLAEDGQIKDPVACVVIFRLRLI